MGDIDDALERAEGYGRESTYTSGLQAIHDAQTLAAEVRRLRNMIQSLDDLCPVCGGSIHSGGTCWGGY